MDIKPMTLEEAVEDLNQVPWPTEVQKNILRSYALHVIDTLKDKPYYEDIVKTLCLHEKDSPC